MDTGINPKSRLVTTRSSNLSKSKIHAGSVAYIARVGATTILTFVKKISLGFLMKWQSEHFYFKSGHFELNDPKLLISMDTLLYIKMYWYCKY